MNKLLFAGFAVAALVYCCGKTMTFEEQIKHDVITKMGTGICDSIPGGSTIENVVLGEITPIGETGLIDVSLEFDYVNSGKKNHHSGAVLYSKHGNSYTLEALGGCDYEREQ